MSGRACLVMAGLVFGAAAGTAAAQTADPAAATASQKESRYQVGVMERVLEGAVEHGAAVTRDRLQAVLPAQMLLADSSRVRGFRLDGYGVFFDVEVPPLDGTIDGTLLWSLRTLDENDLGLQSALNALKQHVESSNDPTLQQALRRVELQVAPVTAATAAATTAAPAPPRAGTRVAAGSAASVPAGADEQPRPDGMAILNNAQDSYHAEVTHAIMDAMLEHSGALAIGPDEWLTIAARGSQDRTQLAPAATDARTSVIRIKGEVLRAFRSGQISKDDALKRIEVRVF